MAPNGTILDTIDNTRAYGPLELVVLTVSGDPIPAVSSWGLAVAALLLLVAGTIVFERFRQAAS